MTKENWLKIKEENLIKLLEDKLSNDGFEISKYKKDPYLDIEAIKDGKYYVIEVKGSEKPKVEEFFKPDQENIHFARLLFQLCCRFPVYGDTATYIMVIPNFGKSIKFIEQIRIAIKKLGIEIWVIDKNYKIETFK